MNRVKTDLATEGRKVIQTQSEVYGFNILNAVSSRVKLAVPRRRHSRDAGRIHQNQLRLLGACC